MKKDSPLYVVIFTFIVCLVFVSGLSLANELTKERVAANRRFAVQSAILSALGIDYSSPAQAEERFKTAVTVVADAQGQTLQPGAWRASVDGRDYIITEYTGAGLWGGITIMLAADPATSRIRGIRIIDQNETPGLGGRIGEQWFLDQFRDLATSNGAISVRSGAESSGAGDSNRENASVDGITGGTRTSEAFAPIVNNALKRIRELAGGNK